MAASSHRDGNDGVCEAVLSRSSQLVIWVSEPSSRARPQYMRSQEGSRPQTCRCQSWCLYPARCCRPLYGCHELSFCGEEQSEIRCHCRWCRWRAVADRRDELRAEARTERFPMSAPNSALPGMFRCTSRTGFDTRHRRVGTQSGEVTGHADCGDPLIGFR